VGSVTLSYYKKGEKREEFILKQGEKGEVSAAGSESESRHRNVRLDVLFPSERCILAKEGLGQEVPRSEKKPSPLCKKQCM